jgi:lipoyl(octanoyl) transferase
MILTAERTGEKLSTIGSEQGEAVVNERRNLAVHFGRIASGAPVEWRLSEAPVPYEEAVAFMEERVERIAAQEAPECVWLLEHPPLYTAGTSARGQDLLSPSRFPVFRSGRGGQYTYHGPGQRVAYVMLDLKNRDPDLRRFVIALEEWLLLTLKRFAIIGERREDRVGIWVPRPEKASNTEDKIAAIGIRVRRWVSFHGISLNVAPDLSHFSGIVPCGVSRYGVTSLADLGCSQGMADVDDALKAAFGRVFGEYDQHLEHDDKNQCPLKRKML